MDLKLLFSVALIVAAFASCEAVEAAAAAPDPAVACVPQVQAAVVLPQATVSVKARPARIGALKRLSIARQYRKALSGVKVKVAPVVVQAVGTCVGLSSY